MTQDNFDLKSAIAHQWEALADTYLRFRERQQGYNELLLTPALLELLGNVKGLRILDAGCGSGDIALYCAERGANVTAVDISGRMIKEAQDRALRNGLSIDFIKGDFENLEKFADGSFDAIICLVAVAGCLNEIIREFGRLIRIDGILFFGDVHPVFNKGHQELRDGRPCLIVSNYFDRSIKSINNPFGSLPEGKQVPFFWKNYTLQDYFDAFADNGFLIERFLEPAPGLSKDFDELKIAKARSYPYFFLIQAQRSLRKDS